MYAATEGSGLFKSIDSGASWSSVPTDTGGDTGGDRYLGLVAFDPQQPNTLYLTSNGLFISQDGGASWRYAGFKNQIVYALAIDPRNQHTMYVGTEGTGIFKSTDGGNTWSASGLNDLTVTSLAIDQKMSNILYAGTAGKGVYKSEDGGKSWKASIGPIVNTWVNALAIHPDQSNILYAGVGGGMYKSRDGGENWYAVLDGGFDVRSVVIDALRPHVVYVGTHGDGVLISTDGGEYWSLINDGLDDPWLRALVIDPQSFDFLYAGSKEGRVLKGTVRR